MSIDRDQAAKKDQFVKWGLSLAVFGAVAVVATCARAGGGFEAETEQLMTRGLRWGQRIGSLVAVGAFIEGGTRFWSESKGAGAWDHMKKVLIGCAIMFGASGIAEIVKQSFTGKI